ncbi:MAG: outer membrane lipoprotein carrier protein LolA [Rickettsiales bacterium]
MKYILPALTLFLSASAYAEERPLPWGGATSSQTEQQTRLGDVQKEQILTQVEAYLNGLTTIQADFVQIAPGGNLSTGKFFLKRPGKMRWQYDPPVPVLLISNGSVFTYYDYELQQVNEIPLDSTLAGFIAQKNIRFDPEVITVKEILEANKVIRIRIVQTDHPKDGDLTMELTDSPMQLRNLIIKDSKGESTNVSLNGARYGVPLEDKLFQFKNPNFFNKKKH